MNHELFFYSHMSAAHEYLLAGDHRETMVQLFKALDHAEKSKDIKLLITYHRQSIELQRIMIQKLDLINLKTLLADGHSKPTSTPETCTHAS